MQCKLFIILSLQMGDKLPFTIKLNPTFTWIVSRNISAMRWPWKIVLQKPVGAEH